LSWFSVFRSRFELQGGRRAPDCALAGGVELARGAKKRAERIKKKPESYVSKGPSLLLKKIKRDGGDRRGGGGMVFSPLSGKK